MGSEESIQNETTILSHHSFHPLHFLLCFLALFQEQFFCIEIVATASLKA